MSDTPVTPIPQGMHSLTPHLICASADAAIDYYRRAFDAVELSRMLLPDGSVMHASIRIGDSTLMLMDENPAWGAASPGTLKGSPVSIHLYVPDVDAAFARAVREGATAKMPPADMFWGDRFCALTDPFGHSWTIATHIRDVSPEEAQAAALRQG